MKTLVWFCGNCAAGPYLVESTPRCIECNFFLSLEDAQSCGSPELYAGFSEITNPSGFSTPKVASEPVSDKLPQNFVAKTSQEDEETINFGADSISPHEDRDVEDALLSAILDPDGVEDAIVNTQRKLCTMFNLQDLIPASQSENLMFFQATRTYEANLRLLSLLWWGFNELESAGFLHNKVVFLVQDSNRPNVACTISLSRDMFRRMHDLSLKALQELEKRQRSGKKSKEIPEEPSNEMSEEPWEEISNDSISTSREYYDIINCVMGISELLNIPMPWETQWRVYVSERFSPPQEFREIVMVHLEMFILIIVIGLISYAGSHLSESFPLIGYANLENLRFNNNISFHKRKLACLSQYVGDTVLVLGESRSKDEDLLISTHIHELSNLWGPLWVCPTPPNDESTVVRRIFTERGVILPADQLEMSTPLVNLCRNETLCHWQKTSLVVQRDRNSLWPSVGVSFSEANSSQASTLSIPIDGRLVLGADSFHHNENCNADIAVLEEQMGYQLQFPGVHQAVYLPDTVTLGISGGKFLSFGVSQAVKRLSPSTRKDKLLDYCSKFPSKERIQPLLKMCVGLEISLCTRNALRTTLWEAIKLSVAKTSVQTCEHKPGHMECLSECCGSNVCPTKMLDTSTQGFDSGIVHYTPEIVKDLKEGHVLSSLVVSLQYSGVDPAGNLQASWPFSDAPQTLAIGRAEGNDKHGWVEIVRDSPHTATFAVMSTRCLEYMGWEEKIQRSCRAPTSTESLNTYPRHLTQSKHTLSCTTLHIKRMPENNRVLSLSSATQDEPGRKDKFKAVGDCVSLDGVGILEVMNVHSQKPPLVRLKSSFLTNSINGVLRRSTTKISCKELMDSRLGDGSVYKDVFIY